MRCFIFRQALNKAHSKRKARAVHFKSFEMGFLQIQVHKLTFDCLLSLLLLMAIYSSLTARQNLFGGDLTVQPCPNPPALKVIIPGVGLSLPQSKQSWGGLCRHHVGVESLTLPAIHWKNSNLLSLGCLVPSWSETEAWGWCAWDRLVAWCGREDSWSHRWLCAVSLQSVTKPKKPFVRKQLQCLQRPLTWQVLPPTMPFQKPKQLQCKDLEFLLKMPGGPLFYESNLEILCSLQHRMLPSSSSPLPCTHKMSPSCMWPGAEHWIREC